MKLALETYGANAFMKIYCFESDQKNFQTLRSETEDFDFVICKQIGLGEKGETLHFASGLGDASKVDPTGEIEIKIDSLDILIPEHITLLKMDIEGSELAALREAASHIHNAPEIKLMICVYHKPNDL